jgi:hypothetical protein
MVTAERAATGAGARFGGGDANPIGPARDREAGIGGSRIVRPFIVVLLAAFLGAAAPALADNPFGPHVIYAIVRHVGQRDLVVQRQNGSLESVDIVAARAAGRTGVLYVNRPVALYGDFDRSHHYHVNAIMSANGITRNGVWPQSQ